MKTFVIVVIGLFAAFTRLCSADVIYDVSINTTQLEGNTNGPFALDFQLNSGDITTGVVNVATLSQFHFGIGGSLANGRPFLNSGNATGTLGSTVSLSTIGGVFFNEYSGYFVPGDTLSFQLDLTNILQPTLAPDEFSFQLIDRTGNQVSTTDPTGSGSLLVIDLTGASSQPLIYTTNGDGVTITPILQTPVSNVPEPGSGWLMILTGSIFIAVLEPKGFRKLKVLR